MLVRSIPQLVAIASRAAAWDRIMAAKASAVQVTPWEDTSQAWQKKRWQLAVGSVSAKRFNWPNPYGEAAFWAWQVAKWRRSAESCERFARLFLALPVAGLAMRYSDLLFFSRNDPPRFDQRRLAEEKVGWF